MLSRALFYCYFKLKVLQRQRIEKKKNSYNPVTFFLCMHVDVLITHESLNVGQQSCDQSVRLYRSLIDHCKDVFTFYIGI